MAMTMKIHRGDTSCGCCKNNAVPMICFPICQMCGCGGTGGCGGGCGCGGGGGCQGVGVGSRLLAHAGAQTTCTTTPVQFNPSTIEQGCAIRRNPFGTDFVVQQTGQYLVDWSVTPTPGQGGGVGNSYTFLIAGFPQTTATGTEGTIDYNGTVHNSNVLTLTAGDVITLVPAIGCTEIIDAVIDINRVA